MDILMFFHGLFHSLTAMLLTETTFPWRFQKSVYKHKGPITGNSFIVPLQELKD